MNSTKKYLKYKRYLLIAVILLTAFGCGGRGSSTETGGKTEVTVIFTGETHGMLYPCDCPLDPGGGLAQRADFLKKTTVRNRVLVDGGAFSAGSIYDNYSRGRVHDSLRTVKTIAAMGLMGYDAAAVGDDDLQYGGEWLTEQAKAHGLPLVSANSFGKDGEYLTEPYILVSRDGVTFGITSVLTTEKLFPVDTDIIIKDPLESLVKIWPELKQKSDHQILLSHLGERETGELLTNFPGLFLAANAHRKVSNQPLVDIGGTPALNFGFQGRSVSYARFGFKDKTHELDASGWYMIDEGMGVDSTVAALLADTLPDNKTRGYDLYIMSMCPHSAGALKDLTEIARAFPRREWNVWFIGSVNNEGKLSSTRGEEEIFDEILWLSVKALYPSRYLEFLSMKAASNTPTLNVIERMGLDLKKIRSWTEDMGESELARHYQRSMRLNIHGSPTLYINNNERRNGIGGGKLVRDECRREEEKPALCASHPECVEDIDCKTKGKLGKCVKTNEKTRAVCEFRDDAAFTLTVLTADSAWDTPEKGVINAVEDVLPGVQVETVLLSSEKGRRLMQKYAPRSLPFFHFEKSAANASNFAATVGNALAAVEDGFLFRDGAVPKNYFPQRAENLGSLEFYVDPVMPDGAKIINTILSNPKLAERITVKPIIFKDPTLGNLHTEEKMRTEEALRWFVLSRHFPKSYPDYLKIYSENGATSFWFNWLDKIGVNQKRFMTSLETGRTAFFGYWEDISQISGNEPVVLMVDNRIKVKIAGIMDFERILRTIENR
ncbi:MAG: hypothetical protein LBI42_07960 [Chitinispirillales bacterium]|nr:hypothetical protein [Chitinispirillales bacterium]